MQEDSQELATYLTTKKGKRLLCSFDLYNLIVSTVEPCYFEVPREMEKKFEIAGFQNNWGSVKFATMNHFLIKYSTV